MRIRLFKHEKTISTIGTIKYYRFKRIFKEIIMNHRDFETIEMIKSLMVKYELDFTEIEVKNENSYYFIITGTWLKERTFN